MENTIEDNSQNKVIKRLSLTRESEGLRIGIRSNGVKYTVRDDRSRYFWPQEWFNFLTKVKTQKRMIYDILVNTGARIEEALNIRPDDFDYERNNLTLRVTKTKAAKGESIGKKRTFTVSSQLIKNVKAYTKANNLKKDELLFKVTKQAVYMLFRRALKNAGFKDWRQFSLHNIRKTHGNWLKALGIPSDEICYRLGHDMNTFIRHYGSANIFDAKDKQLMIRILGDVYGFK